MMVGFDAGKGGRQCSLKSDGEIGSSLKTALYRIKQPEALVEYIHP